MDEQEKVAASAKEPKDQSQPYRIRLPGFIKDEDVGLGDVVTRAAYSLGIRPCGGCTQRAAALNRRVIFTR
jgi:hypothetical protein